MRKMIVLFIAGMLTQQTIQAQGTVYLSNVGQTSMGSNPVGGDSWIASEIMTGANAGGYSLNSVQLEMVDASGGPSNFTPMLYSALAFTGFNPGSSIGTLTNSADPSIAGIYAYIPNSSLTLSPGTMYFVVLTAGTTVANGAYEWSFTGPISYNPVDAWKAGGIWKSSDGLTWLYSSGAPQFAINATAIPEPSSTFLFLLGSGVLFYFRRTGPIRGS